MKTWGVFFASAILILITWVIAWRVNDILVARQRIQHVKDGVRKLHGELKYDEHGAISSIRLKGVTNSDDLDWISEIESEVSITFLESEVSENFIEVANPHVVELRFLCCDIECSLSRKRLPGLEWLIISRCVLSKSFSLKFSDSDLEALKISNVKTGTDFWLDIANIETLRIVLISEIDSFNDQNAVIFLEQLSNLERIWFFRTCITGKCFSGFASKDRIKVLNVSNSEFNDVGCENISRCSNLEYLNATNTDVTDAGLVHLAKLPNLKVLLLGGTKITEASRPVVQSLSQVEAIRLNGTPLEDLSRGEVAKPYNRY